MARLVAAARKLILGRSSKLAEPAARLSMNGVKSTLRGVHKNISTGHCIFTIHCMDARTSLRHDVSENFPANSPQKLMNRKAYVKDSYFENPPKPFSGLDYVLCAIAFFLVGIASVQQIASLIAPSGK